MATNYNLARDLIESLRARYTREGWSAGTSNRIILGYLTGVLAEGMDHSEEFKKAVQYYTANNNEQV